MHGYALQRPGALWIFGAENGCPSRKPKRDVTLMVAVALFRLPRSSFWQLGTRT
jgi:hypothetical protein